MQNFIEEMKWRGMIHDIMPGTEEELNKGMTAAYIGFDPNCRLSTHRKSGTDNDFGAPSKFWS